MDCQWAPGTLCFISDPADADGDQLFMTRLISYEQMSMTYTRPILAVGIPYGGVVVRID